MRGGIGKTVRGAAGCLAILCLALGVACVKTEATGTGISPVKDLQGGMTGADPYAAEPVPLTVTECGQCHPGPFRAIKEAGGRHRFDCQKCHQQFHAYNPVKGNWSALMPQCSGCHAAPHGPAFGECLSCHANPHAPLKIDMEKVSGVCGACHAKQTEEMKNYPSAHSEQGCEACHWETHGQIPSCLECHDSHAPSLGADTCTGCHPAHRPLQIALGKHADPANCAVCHPAVFGKWSKTASRHGEVSCGQCHPLHGQVPRCAECHAAPHSDNLLSRFPDCLTCHLDVHDIPLKSAQ